MWNPKLLDLLKSHSWSFEIAWTPADLSQKWLKKLLKSILELPYHAQEIHLCPH
jgi:hypothetical protein